MKLIVVGKFNLKDRSQFNQSMGRLKPARKSWAEAEVIKGVNGGTRLYESLEAPILETVKFLRSHRFRNLIVPKSMAASVKRKLRREGIEFTVVNRDQIDFPDRGW